MTNDSYKRGQVFGFTVAEAILLVVFTLLLLLAGRLVAVQEEKVTIEREKELVEAQSDKVRQALVQVAGEKDSDKIFLILERWKKGVEAEIERLPQEAVTYREFKELLDIVSKEIGLDASPAERVSKITELVSIAEKGKRLGLTEATTQEQLDVYDAALKDQSNLDKAKLASQLGACKTTNDGLKKQFQRSTEEGEFCQKEVRRLTGGYGLPPCWINPRTKDGVITFSIEIRDKDMVVKPMGQLEDYAEQPIYDSIVSSSPSWRRKLTPAEFRSAFSSLREASRDAKPRACDIWVQVEDCVSNDKAAYKARVGDVGVIFRNKRGAACSAPLSSGGRRFQNVQAAAG